MLHSQAEIESHVVGFYEELFATTNPCFDNGLIKEVIPLLVTSEDNIMLTKLPSVEEVKLAVFSMNGDGVPGPDGFGPFFSKNIGISFKKMFSMLCFNFSSIISCCPILIPTL